MPCKVIGSAVWRRAWTTISPNRFVSKICAGHSSDGYRGRQKPQARGRKAAYQMNWGSPDVAGPFWRETTRVSCGVLGAVCCVHASSFHLALRTPHTARGICGGEFQVSRATGVDAGSFRRETLCLLGGAGLNPVPRTPNPAETSAQASFGLEIRRTPHGTGRTEGVSDHARIATMTGSRRWRLASVRAASRASERFVKPRTVTR